MKNAHTLWNIVLVGSGGFIGAVGRYLIGGWIYRLFPSAGFPWGTLFVNVCGCILIGFLGGLSEFRYALRPGGRLFLMIGILGGFTTFSSFGFETFNMAREGKTIGVGANFGLHAAAALGAVWLGYALSYLITGAKS